MNIDKFQHIYHDMLGNKPMTPSTNFVIHYQTLFASLSILLPIIAVAAIFGRRIVIALYYSSVTLILLFVVFYFELHALFTPLISIIQGMAGSTQ